MWDSDRSASRGMMAPCGIYVFSHNNKLGNAPAHKSFEKIEVELEEKGSIPRSFKEYKVTVNTENLPDGITITDLLDD